MGWFDSGHTDPAPRGETVPIEAWPIGKVFRSFGITRVIAQHPIGKITGDPTGRRP